MLSANNFPRIKTRNREVTLLKYIFAEFIEQWRMVVIVAGCSLFVTSQHYAIFTFINHRLAKYVDTICMLYYTHCPYSLLHNFMCHCIDYKLSALGVRKTDQTKLNVSTEDFSKKC